MGIEDKTEIYPASPENELKFPDYPRYPGTIRFSCEPELSEWQCFITHNTSLRPPKGTQPNWFHRQMQKLILGFRWVKDGK